MTIYPKLATLTISGAVREVANPSQTGSSPAALSAPSHPPRD